MDKSQEIKAANILLKRGVKVPVTAPLFLRLLTLGNVKQLHFTVRDLSLRTLLKVARIYLSIDLQTDKELNINEALELLTKHHIVVSKIVALAILNGRWYACFLAPLLRRGITTAEMSFLIKLIILYGGVEDFMSTIRSVGAMKITTPMNLSPSEKTS